MTKAKNILSLIICWVLLMVPLAPLSAQEGATPLDAEKISQKVEEQGKQALTTIRAAVNGDKKAQQAITNDYLFPALVALLVLIIGYMVASFIGRMVGSVFSKKVDKTLGRFFGKATKAFIMMFVAFAVLSHFGVNVNSFAAILAAAGFAVGMALQGTLSNFAAGIMLLVFRPFKVDQFIQIADVEGFVDSIDLFTTQINTLNNERKIVPNSQIFGSTITNYHHNEYRRVDVNVGVDYEADIDRTRAVLDAVTAQCPDIVEDPKPQSVLIELADSSVNWQARVWCRPEEYAKVKENLTALVKKGLDLNGIGIPFPQMVLHKSPESNEARKAA